MDELSHDRHIPHINNHINEMSVQHSCLSLVMLHGRHLHRPSPSSYTVAVVKPIPPARLTEAMAARRLDRSDSLVMVNEGTSHYLINTYITRTYVAAYPRARVG
jgi:hypothetical protein